MSERMVDAAYESSPIPGVDRRSAVLGALGGLLLFAFWDLVGFDPSAAGHLDIEGTEEALFSPAGSSPRIIFAVFLLLLYSRVGMLKQALGQPALPGLGAGLLALATGLCSWAHYTGTTDLMIPALMAMLFGGAALIGGRAGLRAIWVPAVFLIFAYPIPAALVNQLIWPLQLVTARSSAWLLGAVGYDLTRSGDMIFLGRQAFQVIETCSGMRMIETVTMAATLYSVLFYRSRLQVIVLIAAAPFLGFLVNWARVLSIILNPYSEWGSVHTTQGIVMLVVGVLLVAGLDNVLHRVLPPEEPAAPLRLEPGATPTGPRTLALVGLLAALGVANVLIPQWHGEADPSPTAFRLPPRILDSQASGLALDKQFLGSVGATKWTYREHAVDDVPVRLLVLGNDRLDRRGHLLSQKTAVPGASWELKRHGDVKLGAEGPTVQRYLYAAPRGRRALVYHWFENMGSGGTEVWRDVFGLDRSPWRRNEWALAVQISTPVVESGIEGIKSADDRLKRFTVGLQEAVR